MLNSSIKKVFGILNENRNTSKIIKDCFLKNKSIYSFSSSSYFNNFYKTKTFNFSNSTEGKTTIELIKILRAETSKKLFLKN